MKNVNQHKQMAMGCAPGFARGGSVKPTRVNVDGAKPVNVASGGASQLTMSRRNNGVPGMKKGGKMCK